MCPQRMDKSTGRLMSDAAHARDLLDRYERLARQRGAPDRVAVSRQLQIAPGTLENIRRQRRKSIPSWLMERLREALVAALHVEVAALEHEIQIHRQIGSKPDSDAVMSALAQVQAAKKVLKGQ